MNLTKSTCLFINKQVVRNLFSLFIVIAIAFPSAGQSAKKQKPIQIQEQGSFAVGGTVITNPGLLIRINPTPAGQTLHGDHAYVFYQIPVDARKYPFVMWHGIGQFSKTWETTPDGGKDIRPYFCAGVSGFI